MNEEYLIIQIHRRASHVWQKLIFFRATGKNSNTLDTFTQPFDLKKIDDQIITDETLSYSRISLHPLPLEEPKSFVIC